MAKVVHVIGNGDWASLYQREQRKGLKLTCNLPPFAVPDAWATCIVDFKFMKALTDGSLQAPGQWILGYRPKIHMEKYPGFYMKHAAQVKEFYLDLPPYAKVHASDTKGNMYTNFSCGHMAVHYAANKLKADEINMWGFDSMFDFNLNSCSDFYLSSVRDPRQNNKLSTNWRPIWTGMFKEFSKTKFKTHHIHDGFKMGVSGNVEAVVHEKKVKKITSR